MIDSGVFSRQQIRNKTCCVFKIMVDVLHIHNINIRWLQYMCGQYSRTYMDHT